MKIRGTAAQSTTPDYSFGLATDEDCFVCGRCGGEGWIEYNDGDGSDWGEDSPSEENHPIICRVCRGTGRCK